MKSASILLIGNNSQYQTLLKEYLLGQRGVESVYLAHPGKNALDQVARHQPEVIVIDVNMPALTELKAIARLRRHSGKTTTIIAIGFQNAAPYRTATIEAGADYFISKMHIGTDLVPVLPGVFPTPAMQAPSLSPSVPSRSKDVF